MSSLRELAIAKLHAKASEAGQQAGQMVGQGLSHTPQFPAGPWDNKNGGSLPETGHCPTVPLPKGRDSGTVPSKAGQRAGQFVGQPAILDDRLASARLREWHAHIRQLDPLQPRRGLSMGRWQMLCDDAVWLYESFASQLVRERWSAHDVFGVLPWREGGGVLLDRLQGARNLKLDGQGRAFWKSMGVTIQTCRGAADSLMSSDLVLVWELVR